MSGWRSASVGTALIVLAAACSGGGTGRSGRAGAKAISSCDWPMWGHGIDRTFSTPCETRISPQTVAKLKRRWFFNTDDVVTATPAVVDGTAYVGDWSGRFYALRMSDGKARWDYETKRHPTVYSGQIVSSAAVADVGGVRTVYFGGGKTLYALRADDGRLRWKYELGRKGDGDDPTEIETSPVVVDGKVIVGWDVHNDGDRPAGLLALDAASGVEVWTFRTTGRDGTGNGCGDVWGSPAVDLRLGLVFADTGNCITSPAGYGRYSEAVFAVDLERGRPRWSYQPHEPNRDDFDFAGAPNLFEARGRALVGVGNKDGVYYAVDRRTGKLAWSRKAVEPGIRQRGGNFSTGGFIGPTAVADGIVVGGTAVGGSPYVHALDAATGTVRWQNPEPNATYAAAAEANGVVFLGGTDFTFRAFDLRTGRVVWSEQVKGAVSGGAVVTRDDVVAVAGIREPGLEKSSKTSGVYLFSLRGQPVPSSTTSTAVATASSTPGSSPAVPRDCVPARCTVPFDLKKPPAGLSPKVTLQVTLEPWRVEVRATGLGAPAAWLRPGSPAAKTGAKVFGLYASESDDNPVGGLLCVLDQTGACTSSAVPRRAATYNRITLLALKDERTSPTLADGFDRLIVTKAFDPPLLPVEG